MPVPTYKFSNLDLLQIWDAITSGGGGGSATAANQVLQLAQETDTNTKLQSIIDEQSALGVASGLSGTGTIIIPNVNKFWTNLFIQAPDNLSGSQFKVEVSATSGTANFREVGQIETNNQFFEYSGYFATIRLTRLTGAATTLNWYVTNRPKGDATAKNQENQIGYLTNIDTNTAGTNNYLNSDFNGVKSAQRFSNPNLNGLEVDLDLFFSTLGSQKVIGFSMVHHVGGNYEAMILTTT